MSKITIDIDETETSCNRCPLKLWLSPLQKYYCPAFGSFLEHRPSSLLAASSGTDTYRLDACIDATKKEAEK